MGIPKTREGPRDRPEEAQPYPARIEDLGRRICELGQNTERELAAFRQELRDYAATWMRETARKVAVAQNAVTLSLGRAKIGALKRELDDRIVYLDDAIAKEFTIDRYAGVREASSGQVSAVIERRFEDGVRRILAQLGPILERAGYARDEHFVDVDAPEGQRTRHPLQLDLPSALEERISRIAEWITEQKVAEAKIAYYDKQRDKEIAAELWDNS